MTEHHFQIRELDVRRDKLVGKHIIKLGEGGELRCASPRHLREPYASRWFFNQLIYCRIGQQIGTSVLQVQACRLGKEVFLCNEPLECERLDASTYQGKKTRTPVTVEGYNIGVFYDCLDAESLRSVTDQLADLLVTDQLLWMLDRTPDNVLGIRDSDGKYSRIIAIDHEHCLALGADSRPQFAPEHVQRTCHPTQMSHLLDNFSRDALLIRADQARKKASREFVSDVAHDLAKCLNSFLHENEANARLILEQHATLTANVFDRLWQCLPEKVQNFYDVYAPCLRAARLRP